jgi:prepilin-type N-terminal cleavage/methylation domain-containing protein
MYKKGFTLLEVLVTAVLFVVVAGLATAAFTSTARFQYVNKQSQNTAAQLQDALKSMSSAVERSVVQDAPHQPVIITSNQDVGQGGLVNQILVIDSRKAQPDTSITTLTTDDEWHVYCIEVVGTVKRLARFVVPASAPLTNAVSSATCNRDLLASALFSGTSVTGPEYLTDTSMTVNALHFVPVNYTPAPAINPPAIRIELAAQYGAVASTGESRASDIFTSDNQLVVRTVANRLDGNFITRNP